MSPSADAGRVFLRIEPGARPWTVSVAVFDVAGSLLVRYADRRVDGAPWFMRLLWAAEDRIEDLRAAAAGRRSRSPDAGDLELGPIDAVDYEPPPGRGDGGPDGRRDR